MLALLSALLLPLDAEAYSLRFTGNAIPDVDRVMIQIDPHVPADIGAADFTIEFWMRANAAENTSASGCAAGPDDNWISGNIILDRAIWNHDLDGDFGLALFSSNNTSGTLGFGIYKENVAFGLGICGSINVADGQWHHVAVTRSATSGQIRLFVDGRLDIEGTGPSGDVSYRDGIPSSPPGYALDVDNYLGIGAEKFDADPASFPSYSGWFDELRLSTVIRYAGPFTPPTDPFVADANTAALYHFDEGSGNVINDSAPGGLSVGERRVGSTNPERPAWSFDSPFADPFSTGAVRLAASEFTLEENGGKQTIAVHRVAGTLGDVSVDVATSDGSASAGADYTSAMETLSWSAGELGIKSFSVTILDDSAEEGDETINVNLSNPTGSVALTNPDTAVINITDDENETNGGGSSSSSELGLVSLALLLIATVFGRITVSRRRASRK